MAESIGQFESVVNEPTSGECTATMILMHGTGGTGASLRDGIKNRLKCDFTFPHIKVVFPTAPLMPYTLKSGKVSNVWFDRDALNPEGVEYIDSINAMAEQLNEMIQAEVDAGTPKNRIIIAGFSQGASLALHLVMRYHNDVGACVSLSTFMYHSSLVYKHLKDSPMEMDKLPPFLFCHGDNDIYVDLEWGKAMLRRFERFGVTGQFEVIPGLKHSVNKQELDLVKDWVMEKMP